MTFVDSSDLVSSQYFHDEKGISLSLRSGRYSSPDTKRRGVHIPTDVITKTPFFVPDAVRTRLEGVSQLGLKELWVGGNAKGHTRWNHSLGVLNVGVIWFSALQQSGRIPYLPTTLPVEFKDISELLPILGSALALHDFGHLPFSHLVDEVLQWINWIPAQYKEWGSEAAVLDRRFNDLSSEWNRAHEQFGTEFPLLSDKLQKVIASLILGGYGMPWLQAIVNSPIDADKIDYLRFDSDFLRDCHFGLSQRLHLAEPTQWLEDFLQEQEVNHNGMLCLHGRSAMAAADLWQERIVMYDRFYLSPDLRVPERIAIEIIQQFLIRSTMSRVFAKGAGYIDSTEYCEVLAEDNNATDIILPKYRSACAVLESFRLARSSSQLEFGILTKMHKSLQECSGIDSTYKDFLQTCFDILAALVGSECGLRETAERCLVREPLNFSRQHFDTAREIIRPLQHTYCREALIDLVRLPKALSSPRARYYGHRGVERVMECQIIVPEGPARTWGPGKRAKVPLADECATDLERSFCRIIVIAPGQSGTARVTYIWERVRSALLDAGIEIDAAGDVR